MLHHNGSLVIDHVAQCQNSIPKKITIFTILLVFGGMFTMSLTFRGLYDMFFLPTFCHQVVLLKHNLEDVLDMMIVISFASRTPFQG